MLRIFEGTLPIAAMKVLQALPHCKASMSLPILEETLPVATMKGSQASPHCKTTNSISLIDSHTAKTAICREVGDVDAVGGGRSGGGERCGAVSC